MLDYESIKAMARQIGRPVKDLLALAPGNDPFYAGTGARRQAAEWFGGIWRDRAGTNTHLRRIHYRLVSPLEGVRILLPSGREYQNTENDWAYLCGASLAARYLDLVPFDGLVDKRNHEPMILANNLYDDPDREIEVKCNVSEEGPLVDQMGIPDMPPLPGLTLRLPLPVQSYIVEIWIEKSTQNDWLVPLCQRRGVNLVVGIGEQSEIRSRELAMRAAKYGAPARIIYLSDFDPGGRSMPKAVARKVEFTITKLGLDVDLQLIPLALTPDQCRQYRLPRTPIKDTERRKDKFETIFGVGATELDALEALHPGELGRLLEAEIDNWLDANLHTRSLQLRSDLQLRLRRIECGVSNKYSNQIEILEERFKEITDDLETIAAEFSDWEDEASDLWQIIASEIDQERPDLSCVEVPRSQAPGETNRFVLFDSQRDYFTQMEAYNTWRDGAEGFDENAGGAA